MPVGNRLTYAIYRVKKARATEYFGAQTKSMHHNGALGWRLHLYDDPVLLAAATAPVATTIGEGTRVACVRPVLMEMTTTTAHPNH